MALGKRERHGKGQSRRSRLAHHPDGGGKGTGFKEPVFRENEQEASCVGMLRFRLGREANSLTLASKSAAGG